MDRNAKPASISRRTFLVTTGAVMVGVAWGGGAPQSEAAQRHPKRGGTLNYGASSDTSGLDAHQHNQLHISHPPSVMYSGLSDIDYQGNIVPGIAESWEPNKDLTAWVFRLRKGCCSTTAAKSMPRR
jgi:peptide/nickel transport system substrate-binding protein